MANDQQFPTAVYKCSPTGRYAGNGGRRYDDRPAADQAALDVLLGDGWSLSMPAAEDAYDLTKPAAGPAVPSTSTPEERAAAAQALEVAAADRLSQANEALKVDEARAIAADEALAKVLEESKEADEAKADFDARYADLQVRKSAAQAHAQATSKNLASSKVRQAAADRALDDAAGKVLTMGDLLTQAKQKALDTAAAKQKALAVAQAKDAHATPLEPEPVPPAAETPAPAPATPDPEPAKPARPTRPTR